MPPQELQILQKDFEVTALRVCRHTFCVMYVFQQRVNAITSAIVLLIVRFYHNEFDKRILFKLCTSKTHYVIVIKLPFQNIRWKRYTCKPPDLYLNDFIELTHNIPLHANKPA